MESVKIKDNSQKKLSYEGLAVRALEVNDTWLALHAQILADASTYKLFMFKEYDQDLAISIEEIDKAIQSSIAMVENVSAKTIKTLINSFRKELIEASTLDTDKVAEYFSSLEDFGKTRISKKALENSLGHLKYESIEPYSFIQSKQDLAANYYAETIEYIENKELARATVSLYNGDLAVFESWLISQSLEQGDSTYSLAAIRWALAVASIDMLESLPSNPRQAAREIRKSMLWAVGPENAKSLKKYFLKF